MTDARTATPVEPMRMSNPPGGAEVVEVFADVLCPFTHLGLRRLVAARRERGLTEPVLWVRAWPLEWVNGAAVTGPALAPKVAALRAQVAPGLFGGFDQRAFPATALPALESAAAAYRCGAEVGERFSLAVRTALFEHGEDISNPQVLAWLRRQHGVPNPTARDADAVQSDFDEGKRRGVIGSPHFFTAHADGFCPLLIVSADGEAMTITVDERRFRDFAAAVFDTSSAGGRRAG